MTINYLQTLFQRGRRFLGVDYPILGGAMTWVSDARLVSAISNAGGFGVLASGSMPPERLAQDIRQTQAYTSHPFGVNLIVMHPELDDLVQVCIDTDVTHVVLAGGFPKASLLKKLKDHGVKVIGFAPSLPLAKRLIKWDVDALIIEGAEAGGHIGSVSTTVLAQEILPNVHEVPIFVAGGIGRGDAILSFLEMGASGCQLGTRFVCAYECQAHPKFKKAFLQATARDAMPTLQVDTRFPVIPVRALANQARQNFLKKQKEVISRYDAGTVTQQEAQLEIEHFWAGALRRAVVDGDIETGSLMAGQSVGMIRKEQSVQEIMSELIAQAVTSIESRERVSLHPKESTILQKNINI